jgi:hypothetical protein
MPGLCVGEGEGTTKSAGDGACFWEEAEAEASTRDCVVEDARIRV